MKRVFLNLAVLLAAYQAVTWAQSPVTAPVVAFDVLKPEFDQVMKNWKPSVHYDEQVRVVDMGKYNLGVGIVHWGPVHTNPGDPIVGTYHDYTGETYVILSGGGTFTTGGTLTEKKGGDGANINNGPGGHGKVGRGAYTRKVGPGDVIIIPPGVPHEWAEIPDQVTYICIRPDVERLLPSGYINPLLLKYQNPLPKEQAPPATK